MKHSDPNRTGREAPGVDALDGALRATFRPPAGLGERARAWVLEERPLTPPASPGGSGSASGAVRALVALAAAAAVLFVVLPRIGSEPPPEGPRVAGGGGPLAAPSSWGPEPDCPDPLEGPSSRPDLASLYHEVVASSGADDEALSCASRTAGDSLLATLRSRYGAELSESADATRLEGPFPFAQWEGGTVLAGFPEEGGLPSVLVAERADQLSCCIDVTQPDDPDLQVFTWPVGDVVWLEITQATEPRFLDRFEVR